MAGAGGVMAIELSVRFFTVSVTGALVIEVVESVAVMAAVPA
jgi:hypothetical protein